MNQLLHPTHDAEWQVLRLACAGATLSTAQAQELQTRLAAGLEWETLWTLAENHCVTQLCARNLLAYGVAQLPAGIAELLREQTHQYAIKATYHLHALRRLLRAFAAHGVTAVPLKGAVLALRLYGDLTLRDSVDIDIAIPPEQLASARAALQSLDYELRSALPPVSETELVKHENTLVYGSPHGSLSVDLHWRFTKAMEGFAIARWDFWTRLQPYELQGEAVTALATEDVLQLLILHAAKDHCDRLKHFADVAAFVRAYPQFDWAAGLAQARALRIERQLLLLLRLSDQLWGVAVPEWLRNAWQREPDLPKLERIALNNLFYHDQPFTLSLNRLRFVLATRHSAPERLTYLARYLVQPNPFDWAWVRLPAPLVGLYPLVHVIRLGWGGVRRLFAR